MKSRMASVAGVLLLCVGVFLIGRLTGPVPSAAASPTTADPYQYQFLEVGKTYTFTFHWRDGDAFTGILAEVPRAGWVKVKIPVQGKEPPIRWINLATVKWISQDSKK
jgi:hypothetical protein